MSNWWSSHRLYFVALAVFITGVATGVTVTGVVTPSHTGPESTHNTTLITGDAPRTPNATTPATPRTVPVIDTMQDTDNDGYPDNISTYTPLLNTSHPEQKDIFVEVDYETGAKPSREELQAVANTFKNAPVRNPNGERGINLHILIDDEIPANSPYTGTPPTRYADYTDIGYYYAVKVNDIDRGADGTVAGYQPYPERDTPMFVYTDTAKKPQSVVFMHELGHTLGIPSNMFSGTDSYEYTAVEYNSVMNYNTNSIDAGYSAGPPFNEWMLIQRTMHHTPHITRRAVKQHRSNPSH